MERRQHKEKDREDRKAARQAERDRIEKEKQAKIKMEEDAYEMQLQARNLLSCHLGFVGGVLEWGL